MKVFFLLIVLLIAVEAAKKGAKRTTSGTSGGGTGTSGLSAVRGLSSTLSEARSGVQAAVLNDYELYAVGGTTSNNVELADVDRYNLLTNSWRAVQPLPFVNNGAGVTGLDGFLYVFGGAFNAQPTVNLRIYNPGTNTWTDGPSMSFRRWNLGGVTFCNNIYAIGGYDRLADTNGTIVTTTAVETYSPLSGGWTTISPLPESRAAFATVILNGEIWVLGGTREFNTGAAQSPLETTFIYNITSGVWRAGPALLTSRVGFGAAVIDNKIFIAGGRTLNGPVVLDIDYYDPLQASLGIQRAPFSLGTTNGRFNNAVAGLGPYLFLIGGRVSNNNKFSFTNSVNILNISS